MDTSASLRCSTRSIATSRIGGFASSSPPPLSLTAYAQLYLKEEIQAEALVRNLPGFARFLPVTALFHARASTSPKVFEGGRVYVNEWRALFTPLKGPTSWRCVYLGQLAERDAWFPKPHS